MYVLHPTENVLTLIVLLKAIISLMVKMYVLSSDSQHPHGSLLQTGSLLCEYGDVGLRPS